ncbi:MAG TPA: hypothetical protein VEF03_12840 [Candidatus Binataceae bacterium]|nr:hypothetical protein [Candidatus Binataceae bacterium]
MRRFAVGVVVGFVSSWAVAFAAQTANHNGIFWNGLNASAKGGYVSGYSDAMRVSESKLDSLVVAGDLFHWKGSRKIIRQLASELSMSEFSSEEAVKRLDNLYANQKYGELDLGSALQLLALRAKENSQGAQPAHK